MLLSTEDVDVGAVDVTRMCVSGVGVPVGFVVE